MRFRDLGHWAHYQSHLILNTGESEGYELPDLHSTSLIEVGRWQHREKLYPRDELVRAIDKRAGQAEENDVTREKQRIRAAVQVLREYDETLFRVVDTVCLRGGAKLMPGGRMRHEGREFERAVTWQEFDGNYERLARWLKKGWDLVAVLLADREMLANEMKGTTVAAWAYKWAKERGLV